MKKILVLALAIVMALSVVALVACGKEETVNGEYKYANPWDATKAYGVKVAVTVKGKVITKVEITSTNTDAYTNLSSTWTDEGKATWNNGVQAFLDSFVGLKIDEVNAIKVDVKDNGEPNTGTHEAPLNPLSNVPASLKVIANDQHTGATQSTGRVILAVQNALGQLGK